jgi:hypothetical protein
MMTRIIYFLFAVLLMTCKPGTQKNTEIIYNLDETITFKIGDVLLTIDPNDGAKDISLNAYGVELLTGKEVRTEYYGSSLWLSPQKNYWPQPDELDYGSYAVTDVEGGKLFTSQPDHKHGFQYFKETRVDEKNSAFLHRYRIRNISDSLQSCAAWEVTRLPKKGMSVFPVSEHGIDEERAIDPSIPTLLKDGLMWHSYGPSQLGHPGKHCKTFAFGAEGWLAYMLEDVLLVKQFPNFSPGRVAKGESDVEIYVCGEFDYIELESQSAFTTLAPGEELEYIVTWYLGEIPDGLDTKPGSIELAGFIREIIK